MNEKCHPLGISPRRTAYAANLSQTMSDVAHRGKGIEVIIGILRPRQRGPVRVRDVVPAGARNAGRHRPKHRHGQEEHPIRRRGAGRGYERRPAGIVNAVIDVNRIDRHACPVRR